MRWDRLIGDLEARWEATEHEQLLADIEERTAGQRAEVALLPRLWGSVGATISVTLTSSARRDGVLVECGSDWILVAVDGRHHVIPLGAVAVVMGASGHERRPGETEARASYGAVLRTLARNRAQVRLAHLGGELHGVIVGVGKDFVTVRSPGHAGGVDVRLGSLVEVSEI